MNDELEYGVEDFEGLEALESSEILSNEESPAEDLEEELEVDETSAEPYIDYDRISACVEDAVPSPPPFDADLNDLPLSDVLLLIVALVLGILIVRSKS